MNEREEKALEQAAEQARLAGVPEDKIQAGMRATRIIRPFAYRWAQSNPNACHASASAIVGAMLATLEEGGLEIDMIEAALQRGMAVQAANASKGGTA